MEIGIIGGSQSGRSTLFEIMTGVSIKAGYSDPCIKGVAKVPDTRFYELVKIFNPKKTTPASIPFLDVTNIGSNQFESIRKILGGVDGFIHVVDAFSITDPSKVIASYRKLLDELIISDLGIVEARIERLAKLPKPLSAEDLAQSEVLPRIKKVLEEGATIRSISLSPDEKFALRGFAFWTIRPEIVVINTSENGQLKADSFGKNDFSGSVAIDICCSIEAEIARLSISERPEFLKSLGIEKPAFERIIETTFSLLGRICYFTVGEDEVRAWVIEKGWTAPKAASVIHKDFERGFIKAEVVSCRDFMEYGAKMSSVKAAGKFRLEGKDYIVEDGDIISFRFNV